MGERPGSEATGRQAAQLLSANVAASQHQHISYMVLRGVVSQEGEGAMPEEQARGVAGQMWRALNWVAPVKAPEVRSG
jgi:hypothetical protein